ncbi:LysR family transcriptional regulator [Bordetella genomosp. 13]|uniref:Transcriptional regulator n=1 Tax=Bordetella genomosp. 13 TaxID=463040 RepID=A0A1W6ZGP5_9BORD|nr:LysR family transcriptional regulator [Bordetella genomosp. 13]ARP96536.1 transcriptional regulator [Bordetella genomosp. 13]
MIDFPLSQDAQLIDIDLLNVFCWVAKTHSFSRAAAELRTAQPVVTRKMGKLEEQIGAQLFIRTSRGCKLTEAGQMLAARAPGILTQLVRLKEEIGHSTQVVSGSLSMGITNSASMVMAPYLLPMIAQRWPLLRVNMVEELSHTMIERVLSEELALAVLYDPPAHPDLVSVPLLMERLYVLGRPDSPLRDLPRVSVRDLAALPLVLPSGHQTIRMLLEDAFAEIDKPLTPLYEATSMSMLRAMAAQGMGYTVATQGGASADIDAGKLITRPLSDKGMSLSLTLITTRAQGRLRNVQFMVDFVSSEIRTVARRGLWPGKPTVVVR